ncbi:MAG TPA: ribosome silencing factor [Anaerolineae bacterium]|nr:ribosome silencing factor [Anaerolineae bacterium]
MGWKTGFLTADKEDRLETLDLAHAIVDAIAEKQGENVVLLDIHALSVIADYFIICTGNSDRQLKAIVEGVREHTRRNLDIDPRRVEGDPASGWVLVDYNDIVIHVFTPQMRAFYNLEALWKDAPVLMRML